jgi:ABC-type antimicrobial peptide transport system permease subunit
VAVALGPIVIIATMVFVAVFAPVLTSHSPTEQALADKLIPPVWQEDATPNISSVRSVRRDLLTRLF